MHRKFFYLIKKLPYLFHVIQTKKKNDEKKIEKTCVSLKKIARRLKQTENTFNEMIINNIKNTLYVSEFNDYCYIVVILPKDIRIELAKLNIKIGSKLFENEISN